MYNLGLYREASPYHLKNCVGTQKLNSVLLETYCMAPTLLSLQDSLGRVWFFQVTFLLADTSMKMVLEMPFLSFSNINVKFAELKKLTWRFYIIVEALSTTNRI